VAVRAKFTVQSITQHAGWKDARVVRLSPVAADGIPENERYHKYTPSGSIELTIDNPAASGQFELGKSFYVDFTPAE
jgi:hypothetical protein